MEYYGIRGHANEFFRSYLTNRCQYTIVNGIKSKCNSIKCGVPQGSVLGPLLFLIYINDMHRATERKVVRLFADDTSISVHNDNINVLKNMAIDIFQKIYCWCVCNKMTINTDKTNFVLFHTKNKPVPKNFQLLETDAMPIARVNSIKYLGVVLDEKLNWHEHIKYVCNSILPFFGIFNYVKLYVKRNTARQIYFAFIYSRIRYAIEIFGSCSDELLSKLQTMQNKLLKLLFNLDHYTPTDFLHKQLTLLKVKDIYITNLMSFVNECRAKRCSPIFHNYFSLRVTNHRTRSQGRLKVPKSRTDLGKSRCDAKGARTWNKYYRVANDNLYKKSFRKRLIEYFIKKYN